MSIRPYKIRGGKRYYLESVCSSRARLVKRAKVWRRLGYSAFVGSSRDFNGLYVFRREPFVTIK